MKPRWDKLNGERRGDIIWNGKGKGMGKGIQLTD